MEETQLEEFTVAPSKSLPPLFPAIDSSPILARVTQQV